MKEEIIRLTSNDELIGEPCSECAETFAEDDDAVVCPRCKQAHHLHCWIERGGCTRHGCRQIMSPHLRPPKEDVPITVKRMPRWALWTIAFACIALVTGIYINSQRVKALRESSGYVLISTLEIEATWQRVIDAYNQSEAGQELPAQLIVTPYGPLGTYYDQKLLIMIAANDSPEFAVLEEDRFDRYIKEGALERLDPRYFDIENTDINFDPDKLDRATSPENGLYGIPHPTRPAYLVVPRSPRNEPASLRIFPFIIAELYRDDLR